MATRDATCVPLPGLSGADVQLPLDRHMFSDYLIQPQSVPTTLDRHPRTIPKRARSDNGLRIYLHRDFRLASPVRQLYYT